MLEAKPLAVGVCIDRFGDAPLRLRQACDVCEDRLVADRRFRGADSLHSKSAERRTRVVPSSPVVRSPFASLPAWTSTSFEANSVQPEQPLPVYAKRQLFVDYMVDTVRDGDDAAVRSFSLTRRRA
jgi:hypothetical protein